MGMYLDKTGLSHLKSKITAMIAARVISWSEIVSKPSTFPPSSHVHDVATTAQNGFMASADKLKLNGIETGANKYVLPTAGQNALGGVKTSSAITNASGYIACPIIAGVVYYKDTTYSLVTFGITASADEINKLKGCSITVKELNYLSGLTENIQTQLNNKAPSNHIHTKSQISDFPLSLKNPYSLKIQLNGGSTEGSNQFTYDGSAAKTINITPTGIGAASSSHKHSANDITSGTLPIARGGTGATTAAGILNALGIQATSDEINKLDGIIYNVQEVLNSAVFVLKSENGVVTLGNLADWVSAGKPKF